MREYIIWLLRNTKGIRVDMLFRIAAGIGRVSLGLLMVWLCKRFIDVTIRTGSRDDILTMVATLMAVVHIVRQLNTYKTVQFLALVRLIMMAVALSVMALLFPEDAHTPCGLIICLPVTLLLNEYMAARGNERTKTALAIIAFLLLVAERVSLFL